MKKWILTLFISITTLGFANQFESKSKQHFSTQNVLQEKVKKGQAYQKLSFLFIIPAYWSWIPCAFWKHWI